MMRALAKLNLYIPDTLRISRRELARSLIGAMIGVFFTGLLSNWLAGADAGLPWIAAPLGASSVLLFAVPASPLAQPWPVVGGNVLSALIGVACGYWIPYAPLAASVAVGMAILAMFVLRCPHPPGGAIALGAAFGGPLVSKYGFGFALMPIGLNSTVLLLLAIGYNRLCGRRYPHIAHPPAQAHKTKDAPPTRRLGITPEDLDAALGQYGEVLDITRADLEDILVNAELHAFHRRFGEVTCADIMSRDVVKVTSGTSLQTAWRLLCKHRIKALPVVDAENRVAGIVTQSDFLKHCDIGRFETLAGKLHRLLKHQIQARTGKPDVVGQIMTAQVRTVKADLHIAAVVSTLSDGGLHHLPVIDDNQRLVGILTQSDLVAALVHHTPGKKT